MGNFPPHCRPSPGCLVSARLETSYRWPLSTLSPAAAVHTLGLQEDGREREAAKSSMRSLNVFLSTWPALEKAPAACWVWPSPVVLFLTVLDLSVPVGRKPSQEMKTTDFKCFQVVSVPSFSLNQCFHIFFSSQIWTLQLPQENSSSVRYVGV